MFALACVAASAAAGDAYVVTLDPAARDEPATGRIVLFFIIREGPGWDERSPLEAPFFRDPQPIASVAVKDLQPGGSVVIDERAVAFPASVDLLDGRVRVQAVLDVDQTERSMLHGPSNVYSDEVAAEVSLDRDDRVEIFLSNRVRERELPRAGENLKWVRFRSVLLSEFCGRDVYHRAGVALPRGYDDPARAGRDWPTVYIVPGFGGREESAANYAEMLRVVDPADVPQAVHVVLDPESPLGHHGFVNSPHNGPRRTALVEEFIPHLEREFRLASRAEGRLLYGHSSGGWSVLWLQLQHPEFFGGCWSSAPDPIDFRAFQYSNLYRDANLYRFAPDNETPSYRTVDFDGRDVVHMTVREEMMMEYAIDPHGRSGGQWDAWEAMYSPADPRTGAPRPLCHALSGEIDRAALQRWVQYDIYQIVRRDWERHRATLETKVRLLAGEHDNYYLERAVRNFREMIHLRAGDDWTGPGYVEIVEHGAHGNLVALTADRVHSEIIEHLMQHGLAGETPE